MSLFKALLVAPASLGLLAPMASAAELTPGAAAPTGIDQYLSGKEQVTSIAQFSDLKPTDWAYQALGTLIERYGCVAGYPTGLFGGGQAISRLEAAALLNACLDRISENTDSLKRLLKEFERELVLLKGRVDGLEAKAGQLEAMTFSTTTKLQGDTYWAIGGAGFGGNTPASQYNAGTYGGMVFNYDLRLNFNTSFTGKDLLYTRLRSGNFSGSPFAGNPYNLMNLDRSFSGSSNQGTTANNNGIFLDRLYYRFPVGKVFTAIAGPMARNTEFLAISPFYYGDFEGLDYFRLHGAPSVYNKATGGTIGLIWKQQVKKGNPFFAASASYVAPNANNGNTNSATGQGGIGGNYSNGTFLTQLGYQAKQWKATFAWNYSQCGTRSRSGSQAGIGTEPCTASQWTGGSAINTNWNVGAYSNSFALGLAWEPKKTGTYVPSVSLGWGYSALAYTNYSIWGTTTAQTGNSASANSASTIAGNLTPGNIAATQSWTVGLQWKDAFTKGNTAGMAVGQPNFVTATRNGTTPFDGNYAWEWWYKYLFYLSNPSSLGAGGAQPSGQINPNVFGGLLAAQFKF
ncbi:MAG: S-layer homology domain-containing protein [Synechococcaceae bacterium WB9_2_170]|nr:S-layer homology domain-containing protein [Synechococcaceae bacterium WB9_2_170]